jgi:hypothetical protein
VFWEARFGVCLHIDNLEFYICCIVHIRQYCTYQLVDCNRELSNVTSVFLGLCGTTKEILFPNGEGWQWVWSEQGASRNPHVPCANYVWWLDVWRRSSDHPVASHTLRTNFEASLQWRWASYKVIIMRYDFRN